MHSLIAHEKQRPKPITLLYVKSVPYTNSIRGIFSFARTVAPCLLIIEDIDTQITPDKLSYFFNEVDGLENNDGVLMVATTNHLDKLDEGLKRPSRFDRRYLFPLPEEAERTQYCEFWRKKLARNGAKVEFPRELSGKIAGITGGFSFATMKEAFVATLLALARKDDEDQGVVVLEKSHDDLDDLPLWKEMQVQVKLLRKEMGKAQPAPERALNYKKDTTAAPATNSRQSMPQIRYDDGLTEEQWLAAVDDSDDTIGAAMKRKAARIARRSLHSPRALRSQTADPHPVDLFSSLYEPGGSFLNSAGDGFASPSPSAMATADARIPISYPVRPMLAGLSPPLRPGSNCLLAQNEYPRILGQADVRFRGPGWRGDWGGR